MRNRSTVAPTRPRFLVGAGWSPFYPSLDTGGDPEGRVAIDRGVCGMPETFVVGADGRIVNKRIGPATRRDLDDTIVPLVASLRRRRSGSADAVPPAIVGRKP